jgi:hypothetical protein
LLNTHYLSIPIAETTIFHPRRSIRHKKRKTKNPKSTTMSGLLLLQRERYERHTLRRGEDVS